MSSAKDNTVRIWSTATNSAIHTIAGLSDAVTVIETSPDRQKLVTGSADGYVKEYTVDSFKCTSSIQIGKNISTLFYTSNETVIVAAMNCDLTEYNISTGAPVKQFAFHESPGETFMASDEPVFNDVCITKYAQLLIIC